MAAFDVLIAIGVLFLAGLGLDALGQRTNLPRVTLLILLGVAAGPAGIDVLPNFLSDNHELYAPTALTMVAFLLGGTLDRGLLRAHGGEILTISVCVAVVSFLTVTAGLVMLGVTASLAVILGALSSATDPAATRDVVMHSATTGKFASNLLGIVAVDDAWGLILFSFALSLAAVLAGGETGSLVLHGVWQVAGALILGSAIGLPAAYLTGRIKPGEPTLLEAVGIVFLCAGLALALDLSFLLTGMTCGAVIVNLAKHHEQPFHEVERIEWPFMLLFFVMAGASFRIDAVTETLGILAAYIFLRSLSRIAGGWIGARASGLPGAQGRMTGLALMPQAGVAIGMALVAAEQFPDFSRTLLSVAITGTIAFEIVGPFLTQFALRKAARFPDDNDALEHPRPD